MPALAPLLARLSRANPALLAIAHRGDWRQAPENSLAAIEAAVVGGADMVEIDAQTAADGGVIVVHDDSFARTTGLDRPVKALTMADALTLPLKAGAGGPQAPVTDQRLPSLAAALETARGRLLVNIDTKHEADLPAVAAVVHDLGLADHVVVKSVIAPHLGRPAIFDAPFLRGLCYMPVMRARPGAFAADLALIIDQHPPMIEVKFTDLADLIATRPLLEQHDIRLWVNTLDVAHNLDLNDSRARHEPDAVWGRLIAAGVGAVQTDLLADFTRWRQGA